VAHKNAFDVWIVAVNTVYKAVPYNIVTDWVTQGRLLADDKLKLSGTDQWVRLGDTAAFATFLPRSEPDSVGDEAEALAAVENEVYAHSHAGEGHGEDDDIDMIPLIDISLVLLVFFMMTATVVTMNDNIKLPESRKAFELAKTQMWVGIEPRGGSGTVAYSLGEGEKPAAADDKGLSLDQLLKVIDRRLTDPNRKAMQLDFRVVADTGLPIEVVQRVIDELSKRKKGGVGQIKAETSEAGGGQQGGPS
jgi:biopolymer transport protein ExbD